MKMSSFLLVTLLALLGACKKENNTPTAPAMDRVDTSATVKHTGRFVNGPYGTVTGSAKVLLKATKYTLVLESVNISNGPDLHVYLSKEVIPINFIDLGKLKSVSGTQVYDILGAPDFTQYKYVLVHCQAFNHLFGSASIL